MCFFLRFWNFCLLSIFLKLTSDDGCFLVLCWGGHGSLGKVQELFVRVELNVLVLVQLVGKECVAKSRLEKKISKPYRLQLELYRSSHPASVKALDPKYGPSNGPLHVKAGHVWKYHAARRYQH